MNIGVSSGCFYPQNTIDCLQSVADMGIKYTEIFFNTDSELEDDYLYKLKSICEENDIKVVSVHPFTSAIETFMFFSKSDYKLSDSIKYYERYFKACRILGAEHVVIHGCHSTAEYMDMKRYAENMNALSERRRKYGVYISQENVVKFKCGYIDNLSEFIKYADKDIRFTLDIKQSFRARQDLKILMDIMGDRISHLHISDYSAGEDSLIPGHGKIDFKGFLRKAKDNYGVKYALIEIYNENLSSTEELKNSVKMLQELIGNCCI